MGMNPNQIVSEHPSIALADVHAALAYYHENRGRIVADIEAAKAYADEMKAKAGPPIDEPSDPDHERECMVEIQNHQEPRAVSGG